MAINSMDKLKMMIMGPKAMIQTPGKKMTPKMVKPPKPPSLKKPKMPKPPPNPYMLNGGK